MTAEPDLLDRLIAVCAELERNGWRVDPIDPATPDTDLLARLHWEQTRLAVYREQLAQRVRAISEMLIAERTAELVSRAEQADAERDAALHALAALAGGDQP